MNFGSVSRLLEGWGNQGISFEPGVVGILTESPNGHMNSDKSTLNPDMSGLSKRLTESIDRP